MRLRMYGGTDKGLVRTSNQDAYYCSAEHGTVVLSDGMGGHKGGEVASQMVVAGLREALVSQVRAGELALDDVLQRINLDILKRSQEDENCRGMGATVNSLHFAGGQVAIGHAGDSRTYLVRAHRKSDRKARFSLWCLTVDHNVGTFIERGLIVLDKETQTERLTERQKSRLMRGMGVVADLKADLYFRTIADGDIYLTCSDGLHGYVGDKEILKAMATGPIAQAPERLIELAKLAGAPDNVTVVVSIVSDLEEPLRDFNGPIFDQTPYLLRLPDGEITGPMTAQQVVNLWTRGDVPPNSEVSASLQAWVFLHDSAMLSATYPEFDNPSLRQHNNLIMAQESVLSARDRLPDGISLSNKVLLLAGTGAAVIVAALVIHSCLQALQRVLLPIH